jgi:hypothetical protein
VSPISEEWEVMKDVAGRLDASGIPYMLTGSFAANAYARPRMTRDIDIVVELREQDVQRFAQLFGADYYCDVEMVRDAVRTHGMFNVIQSAKIVKIDFIVRKDLPFHREAFQRRRSLSPSGFPVWVIAPEDLIVSKLNWAKDSLSEMQLADVRSLLSSVEDLDREYLESWIARLGLRAVYERAAR